MLLNNYCHESVGGHTAASKNRDGSIKSSFVQVALAAGYSRVYSAGSRDALKKLDFLAAKKKEGSSFLEITTTPLIRVFPGPRRRSRNLNAACDFLQSPSAM